MKTLIVAAALLLAAAAARPAAGQQPSGQKCDGQSTCGSGANLCTAPGDSGALHGAFLLADDGYAIRSDGRGPYVEDTLTNVLEAATHGAVLLKLLTSEGATRDPRAYLVDLSHPVTGGGGANLGVIRETGADGQAWIAAQWYTDAANIMHMPRAIPIGTTVSSTAITVTVHVRSVPYTLQVGPEPDFHCSGGGTAITGEGTSLGTIRREARNMWVVNLPPGSIGRLYDISAGAAHAVFKGTYYISLHFRLTTDAGSTRKQPNER